MKTRAEEIVEQMGKEARSAMVYFECCAVDQGGLVEGIRMNQEDLDNAKLFENSGLCKLRRIPMSLLGQGPKKTWDHLVVLTDEGFAVAAVIRKLRSQQQGPYAMKVTDDLVGRGKL